MRPALIALPLLAAGAVVIAQPAGMPKTPPGTPDTSRVVAATYKVEPGHTQLLFGVDHLGFSAYYGNFSNVSGTLVIDPAKPEAATIEVTVPVTSVKTTSAKLDEELVSPQFFDAAKYPEMRFRSTQVTVDPKNPRHAVVVGDLTLHGVTKPVSLEVLFHGAGPSMMRKGANAVGFDGRATIKRSDFGVSYGVPIVGDTVSIIISAAFEAAAG